MKDNKKVIQQGKKNYTQIIGEPSTIKSRSAYIMLTNKLKEESDDPDWKVDLKKWISFRKDFLQKNKIDNKLICAYCHRDDLEEGYHEIENINWNNGNKKLATIDHVYPVSLGGSRYDEKNCVVSCAKCNRKKGNKIL